MKKNLSLLTQPLMIMAVIMSPLLARANLVGPYAADTNTLVLLHLDEPSGNSVTTNLGSLGGSLISVNYASDATPLTVVTSMLGAAGYSTNSPAIITYSNAEYNTTAGYEFGYDYNRDGVFEPDTGGGTSLDFITMNKLNIGNGGQTPFTLEALIQPTTTSGNQEIICTDSAAGSRGFQFRITSGSLQFQFISGSQALSATIPSSGANAFVAGAWYHVAFTYGGANGAATLYWTRLSPSVGAASVLGSGTLTIGASDGTVTGPLVVGNRGRPNGTETFLGAIDEVRISSVARAANQMQFFSPLVTITQNPVSQNVDYNQPVTFSVGASSLTSLGYQWLFNSNAIAGATNTSYVIPNVAAGNAGYYSVVVTNSSGNSATSSSALLVVGAANFLSHRYSFTNSFINPTTAAVCTPDSVGGATGTNFGDAVVTNDTLVLDGTTGTYMQLPGNLFNATNATALTVEFWATYGVNSANAYMFSLGYTNYILGQGIAGIQYLAYSPHNGSAGNWLIMSPSDSSFQQSDSAAGDFDGLTMHVACVVDPPNHNLIIYTNGVIEAIDTNLTINLANVNDTFSYIGASVFTADPYLNASIQELRFYNGALSGLSLAQSDLLGPKQVLTGGPATFFKQPANTSAPLGQAAIFSAVATGYLPITYQWFKNGVLIAGATNATYSYVPTLADNGATFLVHATNTIGVTTYVTNSATVTLSVFVPPTLSWLGSSDGGADNNWNTTSLDWTNDLTGGGILAFVQTNGVLFDDRSGGGTVDAEQTIIPYNIKVNTTDGYMFTSSGGLGSLAGQAGLTKLGAGTLNIDLTNNLSGPVLVSAGELQIGNGDSLGSLGSGPVTNNAIISFNRSDTALVVGNSIQGGGTLSFDGGGATTISGNSTYTGATLLNNGYVYLTSSTGLGNTTGASVANGAQLYITANVNVGQALTLNGQGDGNGALHKGGNGVTTNEAVLTLASDSTIGVDGGATLVLNNKVTGVAALTAVGGGTLALNTADNYTGGTTLSGPAIDFNANGAFGPGEVVFNGNGRIVLANGLNFTNFLDASVVAPGTALGLLMVNDNTNGIVTTISGPLEFDTSPTSGGDFVGPISSGYLNVTGPITNEVTGLVTVRNGLVRFSGGGNYSTLSIGQGTTSLGADNGVSTNASLLISASFGSTFDLDGFNQILQGISDGGTFSELITNSTATTSTLTFDLTSGNTYSGVIGGAVALVVNGSGSLYLAGTNTYTGNTTITGGTLELAQPGLSPYSSVSVSGGATLQLDYSVTNTVSSLVFNGVSQPLGVYNGNTSPSFLAGSGSLLVAETVAANPTNITATFNGTTLGLSWPADHLGWILQAQTNSLSVGLSTNWVDVTGSGSSTTATITVNPAAATVFYRLRHP
jgi:autotransporter-associated beta strand protein